jgi:hypothetical protein
MKTIKNSTSIFLVFNTIFSASAKKFLYNMINFSTKSYTKANNLKTINASIKSVSKNEKKTVFIALFDFLYIIVQPKSRITFYPDNGYASKINHRSRSFAEYRNILQAQQMAFVTTCGIYQSYIIVLTL